MKPLTVLLFLLACTALWAQSNKATGSSPALPKQLTAAFIADYENWNNNALKLSKGKSRKADSLINASYAALLNRYCLPNRTFDGASFGATAFHSKKHEKIVGEKKRKEATVVSTVYTDPVARSRSRYEYVFINQNNRWYLNEIFLVDKEGRYATFNFKAKE